MDVQVTCPHCQQRQQIADASGYTCERCGSPWTFVNCSSCDERFHMNPGTTSWTCPSCGAHNGAPNAPRPPAPPATRARRAGGIPHERAPLIAAVAVIAVIVIGIGVWAIFFRNSSPSGSAAALHKLCHDIPGDLGQRTKAVARTEAAVRADAKALVRAGDPAAAKQARDVANAFASLERALVAHSGTSAATQQVGKAIANLPC